MSKISDEEEFPSAMEIIYKLGGGLRLAPLSGALEDISKLTFDVLVLDQTCDSCASGAHPPLPNGLRGALNSLGCLLKEASDAEVIGGPRDGDTIDKSVVRRAAVAALPGFAHLVYVLRPENVCTELGTHHPQLRDLISLLDHWLPLGENSQQHEGFSDISEH